MLPRYADCWKSLKDDCDLCITVCLPLEVAQSHTFLYFWDYWSEIILYFIYSWINLCYTQMWFVNLCWITLFVVSLSLYLDPLCISYWMWRFSLWGPLLFDKSFPGTISTMSRLQNALLRYFSLMAQARQSMENAFFGIFSMMYWTLHSAAHSYKRLSVDSGSCVWIGIAFPMLVDNPEG